MLREELEVVMDYLKQGQAVSAILDAEIVENGESYIGTDAFAWMNETSNAILHSDRLEEAILENITEDERGLTLHQVTSREQLNQLNNFQIEYNTETSDNDDRKGTDFLLKREVPGGGYMYRNLLISAGGGMYLSDEY